MSHNADGRSVSRGADGVEHAHESPNNSSKNTLAGEGNPDSGEKESQPLTSAPVGFWDRSLAQTRREVLRKWLVTTLILSVFILSVLSIYWGSLFKAYPNARRIGVYIVNFDNGPDAFVGPNVSRVFMQEKEKSAGMTLGFVEMPPSAFNNETLQVREAVYYEEAFAAVIINANASTLLRQAVETGNSSYDPLGACQVIYNEARDQDAYYSFIYPIMEPLMTQVVSTLGRTWTRQVLSNSTLNNVTTLGNVPQALSPAIGFSIFNLRPFYLPIAIPAVSVGLIYLIIISFFSFGFFMPTHLLFMNTKKHPPLNPKQWVMWRLISCVTAYFFMSLAYSLVSLAFQIPFSNQPAPADVVSTSANAYGKTTFFVYWMINFFGMWALGMACENMAMVIGMPWTSMWLIFWVITNVATSFYPLELTPKFYYWGYAWPLHNIVQASRTLIFNTSSKMGLNIGILIAWSAVNSIFYPIASRLMKIRMDREARKNQ